MLRPVYKKYPIVFFMVLAVVLLIKINAYAVDATAQYYYGLTIGESVELEDMLEQMGVCSADEISCASLKGKGVELAGNGNIGYTVSGVDQGCAVITVCLTNSQAVAVNVNSAKAYSVTDEQKDEGSNTQKLSSCFAILGENADSAYVAGLSEAALALSKSESFDGRNVQLSLSMGESGAAVDIDSLSAEADRDRKTVGLLFDLNLSLRTEEGETQELVSSPSMLVLHIPLPEELQGRDRYAIYRMHDGKVQTLTEGTYGERIVANSDRTALDIYVQNFCSYALTWEDVEPIALGDCTGVVFFSKMTVFSFIGICCVLLYLASNGRKRRRG